MSGFSKCAALTQGCSLDLQTEDSLNIIVKCKHKDNVMHNVAHYKMNNLNIVHVSKVIYCNRIILLTSVKNRRQIDVLGNFKESSTRLL